MMVAPPAELGADYRPLLTQFENAVLEKIGHKISEAPPAPTASATPASASSTASASPTVTKP